jgi:hypothetical protein
MNKRWTCGGSNPGPLECDNKDNGGLSANQARSDYQYCNNSAQRRLNRGQTVAVWPWLLFAALLFGLVGAVADLQADPSGMLGLMGLGPVFWNGDEDEQEPEKPATRPHLDGVRDREARIMEALRRYHEGSDPGELKALLVEMWGPPMHDAKSERSDLTSRDPVFAREAAAHPTMMGLAGGGVPSGDHDRARLLEKATRTEYTPKDGGEKGGPR